MANPCIGNCACPLCTEDGAEVREGVKGALYIVCDNCVSQIRTMSRAGRARIANLVKRTDPAPPAAVVKPHAEPKPAPPPAPKTKPKPAPEPAPKPAKDKPWYLT
jgi:hypothetical protein